MATEKRPGGEQRGGKWLVLVESKGKAGVGYTHSCGTEIMGATVAHSIHDGPWPGSGSGQVHNQTVPYCPKCESKPPFHGSPIVPEGAGWAR